MNTIRLVSPVLLALSTTAAAAPPVVADLGLLPGNQASVLAPSTQQDHSIALGDGRYLLVWTEARAQNVGNDTNESGLDIFGLRLDLNGEPIDEVSFAINAGPGAQRLPKVAWSGEQWLVTFVSQDPVGQYFGDNIRGVRVASDGTVLDETPLLLTTDQPYWSVAGHGGEWMVVWPTYYAGGYGTFLSGRRIGADGAVLDPVPSNLMDWVWWLPGTKLIASGNEYFVAIGDWYDSNVTKAGRIGFDGQPLGAPFTIPSRDIATDGSAYYVVWLSNFSKLVGSRMTASGTLLEPAGTTITDDYSIYYGATVAHGGDTWWVGWSAANLVRTARVDADGVVLDPGGDPVPNGASGTNNNCYGLTLAPSTDGGAHVLWWDGRGSINGDANVYRVTMSDMNEPGPEVGLSIGREGQRLPDFASGPDGRMAVAFLGETAFEDHIYVQRLDALGQPLDVEPIVVATGPTLGPPSIAFNGEIYMVAWHDTSVKARRLAVDGTFIDAEPIAVMTGFNVGIDAVGDDFLVAATRFGATPQTIYVTARRIDGPTGALLDAAPLLLGGGYVSIAPRVRSDGAQWMVAYHSHWSHNSSQSDVAYNIVHSDGTVVSGGNPTPVAGATGTPDVAWSGTKYLFVWRSNTLGQPNNFISGRILNPDGTSATGAFVIAEAPGRQLRPMADWDGKHFVVTWDDQRHQSVFFDERTDIYAARVTETGTVVDPAGIPIQVGPDAIAVAAVFAEPGMPTFIAGARLLAEPGFDSYRIGLARFGALPPVGDLDGDGDVDGADVGLLLAGWGSNDPATDLNGDDVTDGGDLGALLAGWTG